jgi:hypothetical protein
MQGNSHYFLSNILNSYLIFRAEFRLKCKAFASPYTASSIEIHRGLGPRHITQQLSETTAKNLQSAPIWEPNLGSVGTGRLRLQSSL